MPTGHSRVTPMQYRIGQAGRGRWRGRGRGVREGERGRGREGEREAAATAQRVAAGERGGVQSARGGGGDIETRRVV